MKKPDRSPLLEDETREITGAEATMDEAAIGDAGNGTDPYGADLTGGFPRPVDEEPQDGDISPDHIEAIPRGQPEEDREITAQSSELPPIDPSELP